MPKMKVVITVEAAIWEALPTLARYLKLPSDARTAETVTQIFDHCASELLFESGVPPPATKPGDSQKALDEILDPDISVPLKDIAAIADHPADRPTLLEEFQEIATAYPQDPWVLKVLSVVDGEHEHWKMALAAVYLVIQVEDRRTIQTWDLIERTYRLMRKAC